MEFLRKFFAEPTPQKKTGYIKESSISGRGFDDTRVIVSSEFPILFHGTASITGDIPGNSRGLIELMNGRIHLIIGNPSEYLVLDPVRIGLARKRVIIYDRDLPQIYPYEFWLPVKMNSERREELSSSKGWSSYIVSEENNQAKRKADMIKQLSSLQVNQTNEVLSTPEDLRERAEILAASRIDSRQLIELAQKQLVLGSVYGEVNLRISDPELMVVIPDRNNQRGNHNVSITGTPPSNPARELLVLNCGGRIAITYLNQST